MTFTPVLEVGVAGSRVAFPSAGCTPGVRVALPLWSSRPERQQTKVARAQCRFLVLAVSAVGKHRSQRIRSSLPRGWLPFWFGDDGNSHDAGRKLGLDSPDSTLPS